MLPHQEKIAFILRVNHWSNGRLAKELGCHTSTVGRLISGNTYPSTRVGTAIDREYKKAIRGRK